MAIHHRPAQNQKSYDLVRFFRPTGSQTVVWAQDMDTNRLLRLLRWGNEIYLPVQDGMRLGIGVSNSSRVPRAYPTYIEAANLWDGGPSQPESCSTDFMWELLAGQSMVFDKLMDPVSQRGRPLTIVRSATGMGIGKSTFGTDKHRGQIRIYERLPYGGGHQSHRPTNVGQDSISLGVPSTPVFRSGVKGIVQESDQSSQAAIGAGAAVHQNHTNTGIRYQSNAQPVVSFRVEFQSDLQPVLNRVWGSNWSWFEPFPMQQNWWDTPWQFRPDGGIAPNVPVTPHQPRRR